MAKRTFRLYQVDAFTRTPFCGNPATVVLGAEVLTEEEMRLIAREAAGQDVAFVLNSESPDYDVELRFFSPRREVSFIGHATIAAHYVRALAHGVPKGPVRQMSGNSIYQIDVEGRGRALRVSVHLTPAGFGPVVPEERRGPVLDALGISSSSLHPDCPMQVMTRANSRLIIGLRSPDVLDSLQPRMDALVALTPHVGADGFFVFAPRSTQGPLTTEARMFCPKIGIPEDPVSGNAHGMLGVYLLANGLLAAEVGVARFTGEQGRHVGRPGTVDVEVAAAVGKRASAVRVTGDAVVLFEAELSL